MTLPSTARRDVTMLGRPDGGGVRPRVANRPRAFGDAIAVFARARPRCSLRWLPCRNGRLGSGVSPGTGPHGGRMTDFDVTHVNGLCFLLARGHRYQAV
jgi:hypothetical protein